MNKVKPLRTSWAVKMKAKSDRKHTVALHKEMKDAHKKEKQVLFVASVFLLFTLV